MTQLIDPTDIHSAADTWSGFIYQGKVALYHVLKLINENDNIDYLHLQLDSIDDFAIVRYEGETLIPVSLHQVKALGSHYYLKYKNDIKKLEKRKDDFPCEDNAYFHLATNNEKSKIEIEGLHPKVKIYDYVGNPFCKIENLQNLIIEQVKSCLIKFDKEIYTSNNEYLANLSSNLEELITSQILAVHACNHQRGGLSINQGAYYFTIPLSNFSDSINTELDSILFNKAFYCKKMRLSLNAYYQEFCLELDYEITDEQKDKLSNYLLYINSLTDIEFETFIQKITPHKHIRYSTLDEYKRYTLNDDDFKIAFLHSLLEIRDSDLASLKIGWMDGEKRIYFPSTINFPDENLNKRKLCKSIIETAINKLIEVPFNSDYLVTSHCEVDSIEKLAGKITDIDKQSDFYDKITVWKKLSLINRENAKLKLNEDNNQ